MTPALRLAVRAETTKFWTLRLPLVTAVCAAVVTVGVSVLLTALTDRAYAAGAPEDAGGLEPGSAFLVILQYAQVGAVLIGVWSMWQEADNGSLGTSVRAVPRRAVLLTAKALVTAGVTGAVAVVAVAGSYLGRCAATSCDGSAALAPTGAGELRILLGVVVYWVMIAVLAMGLTALLRSGVAALAVLLTLVLVASQYLTVVTPLARLLPDQAGSQLYQQPPWSPSDLGPATGLLVLCAWVAAVLAGGLVSLARGRA